MYTRRDYIIAKACTHRQYYGQFVTWDIADTLRSEFGITWLEQAFNEDENFNTIPLPRWDAIDIECSVSMDLELAGDSWSRAGNVCILKEVARQMIELELRGWEGGVDITLSRYRQGDDD